MRLPGYCDTCHRFRHVRVSGHALALAQARGSNVAHGVCVECEQREDADRRKRWEARRP